MKALNGLQPFTAPDSRLFQRNRAFSFTEGRATRPIAWVLPRQSLTLPYLLRRTTMRLQRHVMTTGFRLYHGLEVYPLVYPHRATAPGNGHNYDEGFDAAVRIQEPEGTVGPLRSRVFRLQVSKPFENAGDARRASTAYAERLIDACPQDMNVLDRES